jgi:hypothetical protein
MLTPWCWRWAIIPPRELQPHVGGEVPPRNTGAILIIFSEAVTTPLAGRLPWSKTRERDDVHPLPDQNPFRKLTLDLRG